MGCEIVVGGADDDELEAVERLFAEREQRFSRFLPTSELSRVNASASAQVIVSAEFAQALDHALDAAALTGGLVDPTVGAAIAAAGYDRDFPTLADDARPATPVPAGRWREVRVTGTLVTVPPDVALDLNGVVKGLAVDDALALLAGGGFVSAGGDLAVRGSCVVALPGGGTVSVHSGGLATSGITRRAWSRGGSRQHHLIDPLSGEPSRSGWAEVTVSGASCHVADVAAKAAFLLGDDGPGWLDRNGLPARFVDRDGNVTANLAWRRSIAAPTPEPACT
jgi:thiamine biosynthesis lipoprotein